jgi:hypothetical protein
MAQKPEDEKCEKIELDFSKLGPALKETFVEQTKMIIEALRKTERPGKGQLVGGGDQTKLVESLKKVKAEGWKLTEQWTVVIPNYTTLETSAGLRDYVWVTELLKGEGDVANIPYVKDADFEALAAVGNAFNAETTGLISTVTTTLYEGGLWSDIAYDTIEKINQNLLEELNSMLANAAVRYEDAKIMALVVAGTATNFAGDIGRKTGSAYFYAASIAQALGYLLAAGKKARPGECVLYMTGYAYKALLEELVASEVIARARPDIITQGTIEQYLGVGIVVGGYRPAKKRTASASTGTCDLCYLMRGKRAVALAPKRELLVETDKQIATRKLRIAASHTLGAKVLDFKEIVRIWTSHTAT